VSQHHAIEYPQKTIAKKYPRLKYSAKTALTPRAITKLTYRHRNTRLKNDGDISQNIGVVFYFFPLPLNFELTGK
jgi:hypothetical protein